MPRRASGQFEDVAFQKWKSILDDIPKDFVFQDIVAVSKDVSQAYDFVNIMNSFGEIRMVPSQPGQCFADNLKLAFDDKLQRAVFAKIMEGLAPAKGLDLLDGP
jgi:hypothetical protein